MTGADALVASLTRFAPKPRPGPRLRRPRSTGRALALAAVVVVLAACETTSQSARPSNDQPDITPQPLPTSERPSPRPSTCPIGMAAELVPETAIKLLGPMGEQGADLRLASIIRLSDNEVGYEDHANPATWDAGWVIGGAPLALALEFVEPPASDTELPHITALYHPPGDASWTPMVVDEVGNRRSVTIPDTPGEARLIVTAGWTDGCFAYRAAIRFAFEIVPAAAVAACPSDQAGLEAILRAHDDDRVVIGNVTRPIGTLSFEARYAPYAAGDQVGSFGAWDPGAPAVVVGTSGLLEVTDDDADLRLVGGSAHLYRRPDPGSTTPDDLVDHSISALLSDDLGRIRMEAPTDAGTYVLELGTAWELDCLTGSGLAYFNISAR